jgi:hypothetical protein
MSPQARKIPAILPQATALPPIIHRDHPASGIRTQPFARLRMAGGFQGRSFPKA